MLTLQELLSVLRLARAVGQRRFGHFDHEANSSSGPFPQIIDEGVTLQEHRTEEIDAPRQVVARFETFEDPATGEILYRALNPK